MTNLTLVLLESPFAGSTLEIEENLTYLRAAMADCFARSEAPFASHGLYTQPGVLDDTIPSERALGIEAGLQWGKCAEKTVVYVDRGISPGMKAAIRRAVDEGRPVELRSLEGKWSEESHVEATAAAALREYDEYIGEVEFRDYDRWNEVLRILRGDS